MSTSVIELLSNQEFQLAIGDDRLPSLFGKILSNKIENPEIEKLLAEIPSETTIEERRFLYNFFKYLWFGVNNVLEIGPFLGGTTRAIALGMLDNSCLNSTSHRLLTYDKFGEYYTGESFSRFLKPLFDSKLLPQELYEELETEKTEPREFFEIFKTIHKNQGYYSLISAHEGALCDMPGAENNSKIKFSLPENSQFECVFVDGCKSWYGTKSFFKEISSCIKKGSYVIFQDYGWYTCFWIPSFVEIFRDYFDQVAMVDSTYTFRLKKELTAEEIDRRFPDAPEELGSEIFKQIFHLVHIGAAQKGDFRLILFSKIQLVGALAFIGNQKEAKETFTLLELDNISKLYPEIMESARVSPTYGSDGGVYLDW